MKVLLVWSSDGRLGQLYRLRPWWDRHERVWVTFGHRQAGSLLRGEGVVPASAPKTRNIPKAMRNLRLAMMTGAGLGSIPPQVAVTAGTDHHPFNHLISRTHHWLRSHPEQVERLRSVRRRTGDLRLPSWQIMDVGHMSTVLGAAEVNVCHGGPESLAPVRRYGTGGGEFSIVRQSTPPRCDEHAAGIDPESGAQ